MLTSVLQIVSNALGMHISKSIGGPKRKKENLDISKARIGNPKCLKSHTGPKAAEI